jgi:hypothetical protein
MIPVVIEDLIQKLTNKKERVESRQFYYDTLVKIRDAVEKAIRSYEKERNIK